MRACIGALFGIALTGAATYLLIGPGTPIPLLVAPMGASAVLLFGVPASPLAQPWSIIGGNLVSATVGVACAAAISNPVLASAVAVACAICAMFALRCVHPPSGAVALTAVLGGPTIHAMGYGFVIEPIAFQSVALLCGALVYHAVTGHRYPHAAAAPSAKTHTPSVQAIDSAFTREDLDAVLNRRSEMLDIDPNDLESLLRETQLQAYGRTFNELTCADIMSRDVVGIKPMTTAGTALDLLQRHRVKALPVMDAAQRLVGIVTRDDLIGTRTGTRAFAGRSTAAKIIERWFVRRDASLEVPVGALMTTRVRTIDSTMPIAGLVPLFADNDHHHVPVLDMRKQLVGIVTQADVISGLYRQTRAQQRRVA